LTAFFHDAQKILQEEMKTTRIAERIATTRLRSSWNESDREIIEAAQFMFLGSGTPDGGIDCSVKCGPSGFVQLPGPSTLRFPDYDGNGMFRSLGNIQATVRVALLFVEFWGNKRKLRIHGRARVLNDSGALEAFSGAQLAVEVSVTEIYPNCPRYLPTLQVVEPSEYVAALGREALEPPWKSKPDLVDYVHDRKAK
jgi:uncharacterized protein